MRVGLGLDVPASVAVAAAVLPVLAAVAHVGPEQFAAEVSPDVPLVVIAPADLAARVSSAVAVVVETRVAPVGFLLAPILVAFVAVAAAAEPLPAAVVVAVAAGPVLQRAHLAVVAVSQVWPHAQPVERQSRDLYDAARSAGVVAPAQRVAVRVGR